MVFLLTLVACDSWWIVSGEDGPLDVDVDGSTALQDCDDEDATIYPGAVEVCGDGVDQDCDGADDEAVTWYPDADGDAYGRGSGEPRCPDDDRGEVPIGGDCDDADAEVRPSAAEVWFDSVDNDCDGMEDEPVRWGQPLAGTEDGLGLAVVALPGGGFVFTAHQDGSELEFAQEGSIFVAPAAGLTGESQLLNGVQPTDLGWIVGAPLERLGYGIAALADGSLLAIAELGTCEDGGVACTAFVHLAPDVLPGDRKSGAVADNAAFVAELHYDYATVSAFPDGSQYGMVAVVRGTTDRRELTTLDPDLLGFEGVFTWAEDGSGDSVSPGIGASIGAFDLDGDGTPGLVVADPGDTSVAPVVHLLDGPGKTVPTESEPGLPLAVADLGVLGPDEEPTLGIFKVLSSIGRLELYHASDILDETGPYATLVGVSFTPTTGGEAKTYAGTPLIGADLDGDGNNEIVVGSGGDGVYTGVDYPGAVTAFQGPFSGEVNAEDVLVYRAAPDFTARLGASIAASDIDSDGDTELVIGGPRYLDLDAASLLGGIWILDPFPP